MAILERQVQTLEKGKWKEYSEFEKKNEAIESRLGSFPAKKHYGVLSGRDITRTVVWEREWESFATMWATYEPLWSDPKPELEGVTSPVASEWREYYIVMD